MAKVVVLGSSNAIASADHENTHLVVVGEERMLLVDCVSSPILRLEKAGLDFNDLTDLIVTHFHPDHVSGLPLLLMDMWLMGRRKPLNIYGLHPTLDRVQDLMGFYGWAEWPDFYPVAFYRLPSQEMTQVLECPDFRVFCSPVQHLVPTIGLRFEFKPAKKVLAYSCDTEPCAQVLRLAEGADVLIHEAAGRVRGHSSAEQAGEMASQAEVDKLCLIHYPTGRYATGDLVAEARQRYQGEVMLAEDFMVLDLS
jgi:ribonuclease Z